MKREQDEFAMSSNSDTDIDNDEATINDDNNMEDTVIRTLTIRKGPCPNKRKGIIHHMMNLAWNTRKIETILDSENDDLIYVFYVTCVSRIVRKRKWNECSQTKLLRSFVDPTDEAFAMLVIENNVAKWMDELRHGQRIGNEVRRGTLYTQGQQGRKWSKNGIVQFIELWKHCNEYRGRNSTKVEQYRHIERMVMTREKIWNDNSSRKRRKLNNNDDNNNDNDDNSNDDEAEMERILQAMANGE